MIKQPVSVAAIQFEPTQFRKEENILQLLALSEQAAAQGARLIVMPEMGTTGYCWLDRDEVAPYVEPVPGPTTERFGKIAARHQCYLVLGLPEVDEYSGLYYNCAVLIGPDGVIGKHRKTHPYISEPKWAANGDLGHQVFPTPIGNIALLICMDIHFIETARLAGLQQADVICHVSNWLAERTPAPYWINRAYENGCYLIESNRWGLERGVQFSGGSCIIEPDGQVQAWRDTGDGIVYGELRPAGQRQSFLPQRRPELYKELMTHTFMWNPLDFFGLYATKSLPAGKRSRIAVGQFQPGADLAANLSRIERLAEQASAQGAELLTLPELCLAGADAPIGLQHPAIASLMALAARLRLYLVAGTAEQGEDDRRYNAALLIGPDGLAGVYRKIHLTAGDKTWATPGDEWKTFDIPCGRVGLLIGHDIHFPEAGRILAMRGCDIIACPAALDLPGPMAHPGTAVPHDYPIATGATRYHWLLPRVRAGENNVYLGYANANLSGLSGLFGPDTFVWPRSEALITTEQGLAVLDIDTSNLDSGYPTNVVRRKDLVAMRQPHYYQPLINPIGSECE
ncbi:nitrilase-related carbon-nitrogen hydrolase [Gibbsiella quercinecans]|uniref:nitrilase-related carbon-nitrogen hydrolase n=1 Tax=Gibbsiella quercinecans TaxID=929813 RepID=UPI002432C388|nr:nitrilase-related carbon-nitrogen hydrolase [Gibbsiella quercinecans]